MAFPPEDVIAPIEERPRKLFNRFTAIEVGLQGEEFLSKCEAECLTITDHTERFRCLERCFEQHRSGELGRDENGDFINGFRAESDKLTVEGWKQGFTIHFEVQGQRDEEDDAIVKIWNLPDQIAWAAAADNPIRVISGWAAWHDVIFSGVIRTVESEKDGVDKITTFRCDSSDFNLLNRVDITRPTLLFGGRSTTWIVKRGGVGDLSETWAEFLGRIAEEVGVAVGYVHPAISDERREQEKTLLIRFLVSDDITTLGQLLRHIIAKRIPEYHYFYRKGLLFIIPKAIGVFERIRIDFRSGLIDVSADKERDKTQDKQITTLLIPSIQKESLIQIDSGIPFDEPNVYRIVSFKHVSNADEHFTISKVQPVGRVEVIDEITTTRADLTVEEKKLLAGVEV